MGADLYRNFADPTKQTNANRYFRDSYNVSSVMWTVGISWWTDVIPMLDEHRCLTPAQNKVLVKRIVSTKPVYSNHDELRAYLVKNHAVVDDSFNSPAEWEKSYAKGMKALLRFLRSASRAGDSIRCSL